MLQGVGDIFDISRTTVDFPDKTKIMITGRQINEQAIRESISNVFV